MYSFVFLSFFIYILYNLIIITKYEQTPSSLSETYYMLQKKGYWFQIMMVIIALSLMPVWIDTLDGSNLQFLAFLCPAFIIFTGLAPRFKNEESIIHTIFSLTSAMCALLLIIFIYQSTILLCMNLLTLVLVLLIIGKLKKCWLYGVETSIFLTIYESILYYFI